MKLRLCLLLLGILTTLSLYPMSDTYKENLNFFHSCSNITVIMVVLGSVLRSAAEESDLVKTNAIYVLKPLAWLLSLFGLFSSVPTVTLCLCAEFDGSDNDKSWREILRGTWACVKMGMLIGMGAELLVSLKN